MHYVKNWLALLAIPDDGTVFEDNRKMCWFKVGTLSSVIPSVATVTSDGVVVIMRESFCNLRCLLSEFELSLDFFSGMVVTREGRCTQ